MLKKLFILIITVIAFCFADNCVTLEHVDGQKLNNDYELNQAFITARNSGKNCVRLGGGYWPFANSIVVPHNMILKGTYTTPHEYTKAGTTIGCWTLTASSSCIILQGSASVVGLNISWPGLLSDPIYNAFNPNPDYSWSIMCSGTMTPDNIYDPGRCNIKNVTITNAYYGINLATEANDHHLEGIRIGAYRQAIEVNNISSLGIIEDIDIGDDHMWIYYKRNGIQGITDANIKNFVDTYLYNSLFAIVFRRADWGDIHDVWIRNAAYALFYDINHSNGITYERPFMEGTMWWQNPQAYFNNIHTLNCNYALFVLSLQKPAGLQIARSYLDGKIYVSGYNWGPIHIAESQLNFVTQTVTDVTARHIDFQSFNSEMSIFNTVIKTGGDLSLGLQFNGSVIYNAGRMALSMVNMVNFDKTLAYGSNFANLEVVKPGNIIWYDGTFSNQNFVARQYNTGGTLEPITNIATYNVNFNAE